MIFEWERIYYNESCTRQTFRSRVFRGWIVKDEHQDYDTTAISTIFVPDPNHEWSIE